jgi:hypothetical protein
MSTTEETKRALQDVAYKKETMQPPPSPAWEPGAWDFSRRATVKVYIIIYMYIFFPKKIETSKYHF